MANYSDFYIDYSKLDDFQRKLIDRRVNATFIVKGNAGTGKSLIALHKAKQIAALGDSYCVIVYTKTLKQYFKEGLEGLDESNVYHYHAWSSNPGLRKHVKYMIIDECQDFTAEEIQEMASYAQYCLFFGDTAQSIMEFIDPRYPENIRIVQTVEETACKFGISSAELEGNKLFYNYRITKQIADLAQPIGGIKGLTESCVREGPMPQLIEATDYHAQLDRIIEIIANRGLANVGILLPYNTRKKGGKYSVEYVKDYFKMKGVRYEYKYNADEETIIDLDFNSTNPKIMTWWCAKGLQFKDVFIPGCSQIIWGGLDKAIYVAVTRACERLYLCYSNTLDPKFPDESSGLYEIVGDVKLL